MSFRFADAHQCISYGYDPVKIERIARRLASAAADAQKAGLKVFGASGLGQLRVMSISGPRGIVATIDRGHFDGGEGD